MGLQVVPAQPALPLWRHLQCCTRVTAPYLGSYMLRCCDVFDANSTPTAALPDSQSQLGPHCAAQPAPAAAIAADLSVTKLALHPLCCVLQTSHELYRDKVTSPYSYANCTVLTLGVNGWCRWWCQSVQLPSLCFQPNYSHKCHWHIWHCRPHS